MARTKQRGHASRGNRIPRHQFLPKSPIPRSVTPRASIHRMTTRREKANAFRISDLPAELRILIIEIALQNDCGHRFHDLERLAVPSLLQVSQQMRAEASQVFFAGSKFRVSVTSNWCEEGEHFHRVLRSCSKPMGKLSLSDIVLDMDNATAQLHAPTMPSGLLRFREVDIPVECASWVGDRIGVLQLSVDGGRPNAKLVITSEMPTTEGVLIGMKDRVDDIVLEIGKRDRFNGFTIKDLSDVAECFFGTR